MLLYFNNVYTDALDKDKQMDVVPEGDMLVFKIKKNGKTTSFHLPMDEQAYDLSRFIRLHLSTAENHPTTYKKKGVGVCILDSQGEIGLPHQEDLQPNLPDSDIDHYSYDRLTEIFGQKGVIYALFELYDGLSDETVRRIIQHCVVSQSKFVFFGEPSVARRLTLKEVSQDLGVDITSVSRCTRHVRIYSPCGKVFTLDNNVLDLEQPSLFDEGLKGEHGIVSRLELLYRIKGIREGAETGKPLSDEEICKRLQQMGYDIKRRTVTKYRNILDRKQTSPYLK